jgi:phosphonopyruvate decarboxylase
MSLTTEEVLESVEVHLPDASIVSALGRTSEVAFRFFPNQTLFLDGMTEVAPLAFGVAMSLPGRSRVLALDTDGGQLMGLYFLPTLAAYKAYVPNLTIIVLDNGIYESAGSLPTRYCHLDWRQLGRAMGVDIELVDSKSDLDSALSDTRGGLAYIVASIKNSKVGDKVQKTLDGVESKYRFVRHLEQVGGQAILLPAVKS